MTRMVYRKGPLESFPRETTSDMRIFRNVVGVVEIDESVAGSAGVDKDDAQRKSDADRDSEKSLKTPRVRRPRAVPRQTS